MFEKIKLMFKAGEIKEQNKRLRERIAELECANYSLDLQMDKLEKKIKELESRKRGRKPKENSKVPTIEEFKRRGRPKKDVQD